MKRILLLLTMCFVAIQITAKPLSKSDSLNTLYQKNLELNSELAKTKLEIEYTKSLIQTGNGVIANQLSSSQHLLSSLGIIFTIIGLILVIIIPIAGWYITKIANQVKTSLEEAKEILNTVTILKSDVTIIQKEITETKDLIKNNLSGLYQSLQDEEIKAIFKRLEIEPFDIQHTFSKLTTITLANHYYRNIKDVYIKTANANHLSSITALNLIAQHFPSEAFNDLEILKSFKLHSMDFPFYLGELPKYHEALCEFINNKNFLEHSDLFKNSILGCNTLNSDFEQRIQLIFNIWNKKLTNIQKQQLIEFIDKNQQLLIFKDKMKDWKKNLETT